MQKSKRAGSGGTQPALQAFVKLCFRPNLIIEQKHL